MSIELVVPQMGESITSAFIGRWLKQPGDAVAAGEAVVELDTDKANLEVPSPVSGRVAEVLAAEGEEVLVGAVIARLSEGGEQVTVAPAAPESTSGESAKAPRSGPAARQRAAQMGVELQGVEGTGRGGRITSKDVEAAAAGPSPGGQNLASAPATPPAPATGPVVDDERVERIPMSPVRRTIARRLVEAQNTAAILTTFNEVDMSAVMELRRRYQDRFVKRYGIKLGLMSFFVKSTIEALKAVPAVNAEIDGNDIVYKHFYNIGVAVSGPAGLVVPVIRDADRLSLAGTEEAIAELAGRARDRKLSLADFQGGTFTISNGGIFGSMLSTPILNPPQVGILGMHNIVERPVAVDGQVQIRPIMYVALSYDHRVIDGREAVGFLVRIKELIEAPERILLEV